jgi:pimeloyl-ACP methyl ester carboxylesterase
VALGVAPARRRIARAMALDERYLRSAGRMLVAPRSWRAFVAEQRALIRDLPSLERMLAEITAPTRIVVGSDDRVVPMSSARQLVTQIRGAELVVLEGAGHLLAQQQPEQLADVILG